MEKEKKEKTKEKEVKKDEPKSKKEPPKEEAKEKEDCDDEQNDEDEEETGVMDLTVPWLSKFFMEMFDMEKVPFHLEGESNEALLTALSEHIAQEIQSVEGYVSTWRASGVT